jgi:RNA polymerase sigma factor for flagellar operon FliA
MPTLASRSRTPVPAPAPLPVAAADPDTAPVAGPQDRNTVIEQHLPLVRHIVGRMMIHLPSHICGDDLFSAGVIGLIQAVDRYNSDRGANLKTYCTLRIRGAILDELRRQDWVPRSVHREARRLAEAQATVAQRLGREPSVDEVADELGCSVEEFHDLTDRVKPISFLSLQEPVLGSEGGDPLLKEETLADPNGVDAVQEVLGDEDRRILREQLAQLPRQQTQVLSLYYLEDLRLKEIAQILGLTESRVSQIHTLAISRLRTSFNRARVQ